MPTAASASAAALGDGGGCSARVRQDHGCGTGAPCSHHKGMNAKIPSGFDYNIVDHVQVPEDIEPGDYTLSWRWDCEESKQVWQTCSDIEIQ